VFGFGPQMLLSSNSLAFLMCTSKQKNKKNEMIKRCIFLIWQEIGSGRKYCVEKDKSSE